MWMFRSPRMIVFADVEQKVERRSCISGIKAEFSLGGR